MEISIKKNYLFYFIFNLNCQMSVHQTKPQLNFLSTNIKTFPSKQLWITKHLTIFVTMVILKREKIEQLKESALFRKMSSFSCWGIGDHFLFVFKTAVFDWNSNVGGLPFITSPADGHHDREILIFWNIPWRYGWLHLENMNREY